MIRILIADDHSIVRRGIRDILSDSSLLVKTDEVRTAADAVKAAMAVQYDIILLDISFPDGNGLEVFHQIHSAQPKTRVLFLSIYPEEQYARRVLKAGAYGYLTKDAASEELLSAVKKVLRGSKYVSQSLVELLTDALVAPTDALHEALSDREFQVMLAIASGKPVTEIAKDFSLSPKTISTYRSRILRKLQLDNNAHLIRYVIDHGLGD